MGEKATRRRSGWRQDPETVRADILAVATSVFARRGFAGARLEEIVRQTKTSKRMIYYYFGDKEGLYLKVLEAAYGKLRRAEEELDLHSLPPSEALAKLIAFSFDYHRQNPEYIRLIASENDQDGRHLKCSEAIPAQNIQTIDMLRKICREGAADGVFRGDIDPIELHWTISALCVFNVSNAATFSHLHGGQMFTEDGQLALRDKVCEMILRSVCVPGVEPRIPNSAR